MIFKKIVLAESVFPSHIKTMMLISFVDARNRKVVVMITNLYDSIALFHDILVKSIDFVKMSSLFLNKYKHIYL